MLAFVFDGQKLRRAKVEPEGLAALSPQANVQWIKKLHRMAMISFFVCSNLRTSPHLCAQKKATPLE